MDEITKSSMATTKAGYFIDEIIDWRRTIAFHTDEISNLTARLAELIQRNSIPNLAAKVEKQQDKLNDLSKKFSGLLLLLRRQEDMLKTDSKLLDDSQIKTETETYQKDIRRMLHDTEKESIDVKNNCRSFLAGFYNK
jgi:hypothetical protein